MDDTEFPATEVLRRHQQGDSQAAGELLARYARRLCHLAEGYLSQRLAGRVDGEDIVQSVFRTFFRRSARGDFRIDSSGQLWQLLVKMTVLKAQAQGRRHTAGVRDVRLEQALDGEDWPATLAAREPGPGEAIVLVDQIEAVLKGLPETHCRVLQMRLEGHSVAEIADRLGLSRMTVYRVVNVLQARLKKNL